MIFSLATFSITSLGITTLNIKTFSITTFSIMTLSIRALNMTTRSIMTLSITTFSTTASNIKTLSIKTSRVTIRKFGTHLRLVQSILNLSVTIKYIQLSVVILNVVAPCLFAEFCSCKV
jgi:hypothetical protein